MKQQFIPDFSKYDSTRNFWGLIFQGLLMVLSALLFTNCEKDNLEIPSGKYEYHTPEKTDDGWETASLSEVGLSEAMIEEMMDTINSYADHRIINLLIVKDNKLTLEEYFKAHSQFQLPEGWSGSTYKTDRNTIHREFSMTKSVTSTLIGIAIDKGFVNSIDDKVVNYLPQYADVFVAGKEDIALKHLISMSSGLNWNESDYEYGTMENDATHFTVSPDPIRFTFGKDLIHQPGTFWEYNGGGTDILGHIIEVSSGMSLTAFANLYLFHPLNIYIYNWDLYLNNLYSAMGGLAMRPRDFIKIGNLFLNNGYFQSDHLLQSGWIDEATSATMDSTWYSGYSYGYQWWIREFNVNGKTFKSFFALGLGNQRMWVFPEQKMIVFYNCEWINFSPTVNPSKLMVQYILSAL